MAEDEKAVDPLSASEMQEATPLPESVMSERYSAEASKVPEKKGPRLEPGTVVDQFRIIRHLDSGGMGEVYLARDLNLGRKVALKIMSVQKENSSSAVQKLLFEARATANLSHPHIITIFQVGTYDKTPYLALEFLNGQDLRARFRTSRPSQDEIMRIGLAIADALAHAHSFGILHRDLKPANVLFPQDGRVRVLDFGLAKKIKPLGEKSEDKVWEHLEIDTDAPGKRYGTPGYMAPEQWTREECTGATDIWALGVLLFELYAGTLIYSARNRRDYSQAVCSPKPVPRIENLTDISLPFADLIHQCLEKKASERPSAVEVHQWLAKLLNTGSVNFVEEEGPYRGLLPFTEENAPFFFGREAEERALLEKIRVQGIIPIVGGSGVGKSSIVRAGLIPRLEQEGNWLVMRMRPGRDPFRVLAARLHTEKKKLVEHADVTLAVKTIPVETVVESEKNQLAVSKEVMLASNVLQDRLKAKPEMLAVEMRDIAEYTRSKVLLYIDQFEELFTSGVDERTQNQFIRAIARAADDPFEPVRIVFSVRHDFIDRFSVGEDTIQLFNDVTVIQRPDKKALAEVLTKPLETIGYRFEDEKLPREMVESVFRESASLPLLQFAAMRLWEARDENRKVLLRTVFEEFGGVAGALTKHADSVLKEFSNVELREVRQVLMRLVTKDRTRRVLAEKDLCDGLSGNVRVILQKLTASRLITMGAMESDGSSYLSEPERSYELAHDSLIHSWQVFDDWYVEERDELIRVREMQEAVAVWKRRGERKEELWEGDALVEAEVAMQRISLPLPVEVGRFLTLAKDRRTESQRKRRVLQMAIVGIVVLVMAVLYGQRETANEQRSIAEKERNVAYRESARTAWLQGDSLEARAKLRMSLTGMDSFYGRALWKEMKQDPAIWALQTKSALYTVQFSPDGQQVAAAGLNRTIYLVDAHSRHVTLLGHHEDQIGGLRYSSDGSQLASVSYDGQIRIWDIENSRLEKQLLASDNLAKERFLEVEFHPSHTSVFATTATGKILHWDFQKNAAPTVLHDEGVIATGVQITADGKHLYMSFVNGRILRWDFEEEKLETVWNRKGANINAIVLSPENRTLAVAVKDGGLELLNLSDMTTKWSASAGNNIRDLSFHPKGERIAVAGWSRSMEIYNVASGELAGVISVNLDDIIFGVDFDTTGNWLTTVGVGGQLAVWKANLMNTTTEEPGHKGMVFSVAMNDEQGWIATAGADAQVRIWQRANGDELRVLPGHTASIRSVVLTSSNILASAGLDKTIRLWSTTDWSFLGVLEGHRSGIYALAHIPGTNKIISGAVDGSIRIWDIEKRALVKEIQVSSSGVFSLGLNAAKSLVAVGHGDGAVSIYDMPKGRIMKRDRIHTDLVRGIVFLDDTKEIVTAGLDGVVVKWNYQTLETRELLRVDTRLYGLEAHQGGRLLAAPAADGMVRVFDSTGNIFNSIKAHDAELNALAFSENGLYVSTVSDDSTLRLWDRVTNTNIWETLFWGDAPPLLFSRLGWRSPPTTGSLEDVVFAGPLPARNAESFLEQSTSELNMGASIDSSESPWICAYGRTKNILYGLTSTGAKPLFQLELEGVKDISSLSGDCLVRGLTQVWLVSRAGEIRELISRDSLIGVYNSPKQNKFWVASGSQLLLLDKTGAVLLELQGDPAMESFAMSRNTGSGKGEDAWDVIQVFEGGHVAVKRGNGQNLLLQDLPSSTVAAISTDLNGAAVVGFDNGEIGLWDLETGVRFAHGKRPGRMKHLMVEKGILYAATDLGFFLARSLDTYGEDYCSLMQDVWLNTPVEWLNGDTVRVAPRQDHPCLAGKPLGSP
jgi:WD40 repeat protein